MLIQNDTTWAKMPLGQKVTWAIVYLGKDTTWAMWSLGQKPTWAMLAGAIVAWAKKALGNRGLGKSGSTAVTLLRSLHFQIVFQMYKAKLI